MTLDDLIAGLKAAPPTAPLVFETAEGEIGGGYHLTELKLARITGIDCGGRVTSWMEASLQVLDGRGGAPLATAKVADIVGRGADRVPGLADAPLHVEFAPGNAGLRRFEITAQDARNGRTVVTLAEGRATCKALSAPASPRREGAGSAACCSRGGPPRSP